MCRALSTRIGNDQSGCGELDGENLKTGESARSTALKPILPKTQFLLRAA